MAEELTDQAARRARRAPRWLRRLSVASRKANLFAVLEIVTLAAFGVMAVTTWLALSRVPGDTLLPSVQTTVLLIGTLIPAMALLILLGRRFAMRRTAGTSGRLHVRLVFFFSLVAAIPTLLVAIFASVLFQSGVEFWFSDRSRGIVENANQLARGYYEQNQRDMADNTVTMANDLRAYLQQAPRTSQEFQEGYFYQVLVREFNESAILQRFPNDDFRTAIIVDPEGDEERQRASPEAIARLDAGEAVVVEVDEGRISAITPIDRDAGIYLTTARTSNAQMLNQYESARNIVEAFDALSGRARSLQVRMNLALFFVSLALVGVAIWFALRFADRQVTPLTDLVTAARRVGAGNYALRIEGRTGADEIGLLNRAFNRMTAQIERQTAQLVGANSQLEDRRAFIEAVLESVSAGVLSLDGNGAVRLMNSSAQLVLLGRVGPTPVGQALSEISPPLAAFCESGHDSGLVQSTRDGELRTLAVTSRQDVEGQVITFDDITRRLFDQRQAAWSDVARRIAHEIKNPLTPIQLATERLKRRYGRQIEQDPELFADLTSTIIRQVGDLRKMVDEFSSFARLPKPVFRQEDALDLVRQALFLQEVARSEIDFAFTSDSEKLTLACDRHQFGQAIANVIKNATEAVEARGRDAEPDYRARVAIAVRSDEAFVTVTVSDNGVGLPESAERLVEPYVTTRERGTGLGLAIVKKIVEEHGGSMAFSAAKGGGAEVALKFARDPQAAHATGDAAEL